MDYEERFSPVVRFASIRLFLASVTSMDLELFRLDDKTAFLNSELEEDIYMVQPAGFVAEGEEHKIFSEFLFGAQGIVDTQRAHEFWCAFFSLEV